MTDKSLTRRNTLKLLLAAFSGLACPSVQANEVNPNFENFFNSMKPKLMRCLKDRKILPEQLDFALLTDLYVRGFLSYAGSDNIAADKNLYFYLEESNTDQRNMYISVHGPDLSPLLPDLKKQIESKGIKVAGENVGEHYFRGGNRVSLVIPMSVAEFDLHSDKVIQHIGDLIDNRRLDLSLFTHDGSGDFLAGNIEVKSAFAPKP